MAVTKSQLNAFEAAIARNLTAGTILAGYDICFRVEDAADIKFWQQLLASSIRSKKVKFFDLYGWISLMSQLIIINRALYVNKQQEGKICAIT